MRVLFIIFIFLLISCEGKETKTRSVFAEPKLKPIYYNKICQGDSCSYVHFLMLSSYDEKNFNDYNFVYIADKYLDSVHTKLPVAEIQFCRPFKFQMGDGSKNSQQLMENSLVSIWYENQSTINKVPEISNISIWTNGNRKDMEYLHVKSRKQRMNNYISEK